MEPLEKEMFLREVADYGYQLAMPQSAKAENVLHRMLMEDDLRVLEGVPVVLTNMLLGEHISDLIAFEKELPGKFQRRFRMLAAITTVFLDYVPDSNSTKARLTQYLRKREPSLLENIQQKLRNDGKIVVGNGATLDGQRLEKTYRNYALQQDIFSKQLENKKKAVFEEAMTELFTDKQKELVLKMLKHQTLSKTEREYYSRVVKPRLKALRNSDLQAVASTLLGY